MSKLAIVGSRYYNNYKAFSNYVDDYIKEIGEITVIISGGCRETDLMAERYAKEHKIEFFVFEADWKGLGSKAGPIRNQKIISASTHVIAFKAKNSKGTLDSIRKAKKYKKKLLVIDI